MKNILTQSLAKYYLDNPEVTVDTGTLQQLRLKVMHAIALAAEQGKRISPNSKIIKAYKNALPEVLPLKYFSIILGHMLGDVTVKYNHSTQQACIQFEWGNEAYAHFVYNLLNMYIISAPRKQVRTNANGNQVTTYCFQTISHGSLAVFYHLFIVDGKKTVVNGLVSNLLTPLALAIWYMDDGGFTDYREGHGQGLQLHTQGFSVPAVEQMVVELNDKYDLKCWVRLVKQGKPIICIPSGSYRKFYNLVKDHVDVSMKHKLPLPRK